MPHLRNLHSPISADYSLATCRAIGSELAKRIAYVRGSAILPIFERHKGTYRSVTTVFMVDDDAHLIRPDDTIESVHEYYPGFSWYEPVINEFLVESLAHRILHAPVLRKARGEDAILAVPRIGRTDAEFLARSQAIHFMLGFLVPNDELIAAFTRGDDDATIAARHGVTQRLIGRRREGLCRKPDDAALAAPIPDEVGETSEARTLEPA